MKGKLSGRFLGKVIVPHASNQVMVRTSHECCDAIALNAGNSLLFCALIGRNKQHPCRISTNHRMRLRRLDAPDVSLSLRILGATHLLFQLEHVLVELLLELLVRIVDAELLKAVDLEELKPVDVQDTYEPLQRLRRLRRTRKTNNSMPRKRSPRIYNIITAHSERPYIGRQLRGVPLVKTR
jgi:hypothetical protein